MERDFIAVIDFGGQYAHLIAKRIRHLGVYSTIFSPMTDKDAVRGAKGLILSGGPQSVFGAEAIPFNKDLLQFDGPLLGLCYGHQLLCHHLGGDVQAVGRGEYGHTTLHITNDDKGSLFLDVPKSTSVWMSHGDTVMKPPPGFRVDATTELCPVAAISHETKPVFGLQFHPEVNDTPEGKHMLASFVAQTGAEKSWNMAAFVAEAVAEIGRAHV